MASGGGFVFGKPVFNTTTTASNIFGSTPAAATSNIFGTTPATTTTASTNLFGGLASKTGGGFTFGSSSTAAPNVGFGALASGFTLGNTQTSANAASAAPPLFGTAPTSTAGSNQTSSNIFGSTPATTSNIFATAPAATTTASSNLFGGLASKSGGGFSFGTSSTAVAPNVGFGALAPGFTSGNTQSSANTASAAPPLFGTAPTLTIGSNQASSNASNIFGSTPAATSNIFGTTPAAATTASSNLFGGLASKTGGGFSFGSSSTAAPNVGFGATALPTAATSGFTAPVDPVTTTAGALASGFTLGNAQSSTSTASAAPPPLFGIAAPASTAVANQASSHIFGSTPATTSNIFGTVSPTTTTSASSNLLGGLASKPGGGFAFGTSSTAAPNVGFGATALPPATTSGFTAPVASASTTGAVTSAFTLGSTQPSANVTSTATPLFGITPASTTATNQAVTTALNMFGSTPATTSSNIFGSALPTTTTSAASNLLGGLAARSGVGIPLTTALGIPSTTASNVGFGTTTLPPATTSGFTAPADATASAATAVAAKPITYQQLEELINKWTMDLEEQERLFLTQATQINAWDRVLMENSDKILKLYEDVNQLEGEQRRVDFELDFVSQQQNELNQIVEQLEKSLANDGEAIGVYGQHSDARREEMAQLQTTIDCQLKQVGRDVSQLVERISNASDMSTDIDPLKQMVAILSKQMDSLQWIDGQISTVERRTREMQTDIQKRRKDAQDKALRH